MKSYMRKVELEIVHLPKILYYIKIINISELRPEYAFIC